MRTILATLGVLCALAFSAPSDGNSDLRELWASISFATESGDRVSIRTASGKIAGITLTLNGVELDVPTSCFEELENPLLWGTRLSRSIFVEEGVRWEAQRLEIPILQDGPSWDAIELFPVAVFHLAEGRVRSGNLWTNSRMTLKVKTLCE